MTRKKVHLAYITNDSARKATFKKRKKGLMKKVSELSTLCGINACAIIYSPYDAQPEVWPSAIGVQRVLSDFRMLPEMDQSKKMVNQESFMRQRISKASEHLKRQRKDNREKEMTQVMFQCLMGRMGLQHLNIMDLNDLGWLIDQYHKDINRRKETLKRSAKTQHNSELRTTTVPPTPTAAVIPTPTLQSMSSVNAENHTHVSSQQLGLDMNVVDSMQRQQQWFLNLMNNPQEQMGFGADDDMFQFVDQRNNTNIGTNNTINNNNPTHTSIWSTNFFP